MAQMMMEANGMHFQFMEQMPTQRPPYVLTFGKHIGRPLTEVPEDYKEWLVFHKFHLRRPDLYEALDEDGYFRPKPKPQPVARPHVSELSHAAAAPAEPSKRRREDEDVRSDSANKCARHDGVEDVKKAGVQNGTVSDEVASWCRQNSDNVGGWEGEEDLFLGLFGKEGNLNAEETNDPAFDAVLMLDDGSSENFQATGEFQPETDAESVHTVEEHFDEEDASRADTPSTVCESARELGSEGNKINEGFELQAVLVDAFQAFERGDCKTALKLLRSSIHKVIQLEANLNEQERLCMQQTLVTVVHAARMIACKFRDNNNKQLIDKGDHYRRSGLFEGAVLMYAEAVDLSSV